MSFLLTIARHRMNVSSIAARRLLALGFLAFVPAHYALADLMLFPTRIVFEKNQRTAQIELVNNGQQSSTYRISLVNRRMTETGEFANIDTPLPGEKFVDQMLRYSPRQVTLAPGSSQTVRIMLRKPADLADGEYRSHLQFDRLPPPEGQASIETSPPAEENQIGVQLTALVGASIPIIVRHGTTWAEVTLANLEVDKNINGEPPVLSLQLNRTGNRSVYGDLTVSFTPRGGLTQVIAKAAGVAVYTPNTVRRAKLTLQPQPAMELRNGSLRVTYNERPEDGGKLLAEATLALP